MGRHRLKQRGAPWLVVERDHHRVARPHTGINGRCGEGASQKDGGADQEEGRCADLDGDQGTVARVPGAASLVSSPRIVRTSSRRVALQRRCEAEESRRDNRRQPSGTPRPASPSGDEAGEFDLEEQRSFRPRGRRDMERTRQKQPRDSKAACRRRERKEKVLREQLPDDAPA